MSSRNMSSSNTKVRTILRIKRRRTDEPLPFLRLEGLDGRVKRRREGDSNNSNKNIDSNLSNLFQNATNLHGKQVDGRNTNTTNNTSDSTTTATTTTTTTTSITKSSAVWKRVSPDNDEAHSYRIVDALLEDDGPKTKRRKLTVLETSSQKDLLPSSSDKKVSVRRKTPLKVLDPLSRLVDDSLQEVHGGTKSVPDHYRFIRMDPRLAYDFHTKWIAWSHSSGGNILHACAMWNDVEIASEILQLSSSLPVPPNLTEAGDGDGRTPYELAQLSGHDSVCQVLEAFGGDTTNYVYDIFCLEEDDNGDEHREQGDKKKKEQEEQTMAAVELTSGVGYWTPHGELVLEAPEKFQASLDHVFDEDVDSNCEEYGGNDYPDEGEDDTSWAEFGPDQGFRHHNVELDTYDDSDYYDEVGGWVCP